MITYLFIALIAAHATGDFVFQTSEDAARKDVPAVLLRHGLIHAVLAYLLLGIPSAWPVAAAIFGTHVLIDYGKVWFGRDDLKAFSIDQASHVAAAGVVAAAYSGLADPATTWWLSLAGADFYAVLAVAAGLVLTLRAGAYFVDLAVDPFLRQINLEGRATEKMRGLREGGRTIGQLERALIFLFVLIDQFTAIGFLITAKSIFRFGELKERGNRMEAEYIIIGTLISFLWALVIALVVRHGAL